MLFSSLRAIWGVPSACGWVLNCVCVFQLWLQRRGATLAPLELSTHLTLLGLQVKAEYTCFSVLHPPTLPVFVDAFYSLFSTHESCWLFYRKSVLFFFLHSSTSRLFFFIVLTFCSRMSKPVESHVSAFIVDNHFVNFVFFFSLSSVPSL